MASDALPKPRLVVAAAVCLLLPVFLGVGLGWSRSGPRAPGETAIAEDRVDPPDLSPSRAGPRPPREAANNKRLVAVSAVAQPWWALLTPAEAKVRAEDFEFMYDQPGAFPEFSEISRQLTDAGVPIEIVRLESREIFGALLQRRMYSISSVEFHGAAEQETSEGMREADRLVVSVFTDRAAAAEAEVLSRLTNNGVALDSEPARRILQLGPTTPLRPLDPAPELGVNPVMNPSHARKGHQP